MLKLEHIHKRFGAVCAADDVTLELADGESLVLVGESGSGKTTLAKIAAGIQTPDHGRVLLDGRPLAPLCRRRSFDQCAGIQYIFQDPYGALDPDVTVRRVLNEPARICRRRGCAFLPAEEALLYVDRRLLDFLNRPLGELSGGQRQKICIARALMPLPRLIIADESTAMLDRQSGRDIFDLLHRIKDEKGVSLLVILHDVDFSYARWDRIAVMWQGKLVEQARFSDFPAGACHPYSHDLLSAYDFFNGKET